MQFSTIAVSFLASVAVATPAMRRSLYKRGYTPCSDTFYGNADCCSVDILGVADLDCATGKSDVLKVHPASFVNPEQKNPMLIRIYK